MGEWETMTPAESPLDDPLLPDDFVVVRDVLSGLIVAVLAPDDYAAQFGST